MTGLLVLALAIPLPKPRAVRSDAQAAVAAVRAYAAVMRLHPAGAVRGDRAAAERASRTVVRCFLSDYAPASLCFATSTQQVDAAAWNAALSAAALLARSEKDAASGRPRGADRLLRESRAYLAAALAMEKSSRRLGVAGAPIEGDEDAIFRGVAAGRLRVVSRPSAVSPPRRPR